MGVVRGGGDGAAGRDEEEAVGRGWSGAAQRSGCGEGRGGGRRARERSRSGEGAAGRWSQLGAGGLGRGQGLRRYEGVGKVREQRDRYATLWARPPAVRLATQCGPQPWRVGGRGRRAAGGRSGPAAGAAVWSFLDACLTGSGALRRAAENQGPSSLLPGL